MSNLNTTLKNIIIVGIFSSLLIPFIISTNLYFPFITGKGFVFRILVEVLFFLWIILVVRDRSYLPKKNPIFISFSVFILITFIADFFGANREVSLWSNFERMDGFVLLIHVYAYFIILLSIFKTDKIWNWFLNSSVIVSIVMVGYSLLQIWGFIKINQGGVRVDGTFGNAIYLAVYMMFNIFFAIYLLYKHRSNKNLLIIYSIAILLQSIVLYQTATRGVMLGLIAGIFVGAIIFTFLTKEIKFKKIGLGFLAGIVLLVGIFIAVKDNPVISENPVLGRLASISLQDKTTFSRFTIWGMAWQGFLERPILGYGHGNFNLIFDSKYDPRLYDQEQWFDRAHNIIFDRLIAGGVLGLLAYLSIFIFTIHSIFRSISLSIFEKSIFVGLLIAYIFQNLFAFDNLFSYILFAVVLSFIYYSENKNKENSESTGPLVDNPSIINAISVGSVVVMFFVIYSVNVPAISANSDLLKAISVGRNQSGEMLFAHETPENHINLFKKALSKDSFGDVEIRVQVLQKAIDFVTAKNISEQTKLDLVNLSILEMEKQIAEYPDDSRFYYVLGSMLASIGMFEQGKVFLEKAVEISPNKQSIRYALPITYFRLGEVEKALSFSKETYELATENDQAWRAYIDIAASAGRTDVIEQLVLDSINIKPSRVVGFYQDVVNRNPENLQFRVSLILAYAKAGMIQNAFNEAEKAKVDFPQAVASFNRITEQLQSGQF